MARTTCEKGFGLVGFLALMPLLLGVLALISGSALLFKADAHLKQECRMSVLSSQRAIAENLRRLISLNPRARELRFARREAEIAVKASLLYPPALAAAQTELAAVKLAQAAFATEQRILLSKARIDSTTAPLRARTSVLNGLNAEARSNGVSLPAFTSQSRRGLFDVVATPKGDPTPDYNPAPRFTAEQIVDVNVQIELGPLLPAWLRDLLPTRGLTVDTHCQATIEKRGNSWVETLSAVK